MLIRLLVGALAFLAHVGIASSAEVRAQMQRQIPGPLPQLSIPADSPERGESLPTATTPTLSPTDVPRDGGGPEPARATKPTVGLPVPRGPESRAAKLVDAAPQSVPAIFRVSVKTDKVLYRNGERVKLSGKVVNLAGDGRPKAVVLRIAREIKGVPDWENPNYRVLIELTSADFSDEGYLIQLPVAESAWNDQRERFVVAAEVLLADHTADHADSIAITTFTAQEIGYKGMAWMFTPPISLTVAFVALSLVVCMRTPSKRSAKMAVFVIYGAGLLLLLVALIGPLLISFSPGTEAIFRATPVGIVKVATDRMKEVQWLLNIGGVVTDGTVRGGFNVPLFILILGMIGGVISMLLKLPDFIRDYDAIVPESSEECTQVSTLCTGVAKYFIYIITAPFLGMIAYSFTTLLDYSNAFVLSILAFSVGFVSDGIVEAMVSVSEGWLQRVRNWPGPSDPGRSGGGGSPATPAAATTPATTLPHTPLLPAAGVPASGSQLAGNGVATTTSASAPPIAP